MDNTTQIAEQNDPAVVKYDGPTPGPWSTDEIGSVADEDPCIWIYASNGNVLAKVLLDPIGQDGSPITSDLPVEANARLIAAAPDMLAALQECVRVLGIRKDFVPLGPALTLAPIIGAAIDKAVGDRDHAPTPAAGA